MTETTTTTGTDWAPLQRPPYEPEHETDEQ